MADITEQTSPTGTRRDDSEIKLVELRKLRLERVILVGVAVGGSIEATERSLEELRRLTETAGAEVVDRTALILDIFAQHATSREGKAQVELAQLNYLLPRLRGWGESLNRMGGGIGTRRGPGRPRW